MLRFIHLVLAVVLASSASAPLGAQGHSRHKDKHHHHHPPAPPDPVPTPTPAPDSGGITPPAPATGYRLAFDDEFNSLSLGGVQGTEGFNNWYLGYWWDPYIPPSSNVTVSNGVLDLLWTRTQGSTETSISTIARDATVGRRFRYGYFEARMRWDVTTGAWPAFWALPVQAVQAQQHTGELDFFEGEGGDPHTFFGTAHEWQGGTQLWVSDPSDFPVGSNTDFSQWHTYGALWVPGELSWFLDGRLIGSTNLPPIFDQQDFFLVLSMKEGARWQAGNLHGVSAQSLNLYVDYVRVWQP